jgi:hypothetical protein
MVLSITTHFSINSPFDELINQNKAKASLIIPFFKRIEPFVAFNTLRSALLAV